MNRRRLLPSSIPACLSGRPGGFAGVLAAMAAMGPGAVLAEIRAEPVSMPVMAVKPLAIVSMPTEPGKVYQMQASSDLAVWENSGSPVVGTGEPITRTTLLEGPRFFRLKVLDHPQVGAAPWELAGSSLQFNEGNRIVRCAFAAGGQGTWQTTAPESDSRSCSWTWNRRDFDEGRVEMNFADGAREVLKLRFHAPLAGRFTRELYSAGRLVDTDDGSFGPAPDGGAAATPATLVGRSLVLGDAPAGSSLTFTGTAGGTRLLDGEISAFSGQWLVTGVTTARIIAHFDSTHGEEYSFVFTAPLTGRYTRRTYTGGIFRDEDAGTFCLTSPPPP